MLHLHGQETNRPFHDLRSLRNSLNANIPVISMSLLLALLVSALGKLRVAFEPEKLQRVGDIGGQFGVFAVFVFAVGCLMILYIKWLYRLNSRRAREKPDREHTSRLNDESIVDGDSRFLTTLKRYSLALPARLALAFVCAVLYFTCRSMGGIIQGRFPCLEVGVSQLAMVTIIALVIELPALWLTHCLRNDEKQRRTNGLKWQQ
jgi:hypothetical protein